MRSRAILISIILLLTMPSTRLHAQAATSQSDPQVQSAVRQGREADSMWQLAGAMDAYRRANQLAQGKCEECLRALFEDQMLAGLYRDAVSTSQQLENQSATPKEKAEAASCHVRALLGAYQDKPKANLLEQADRILHNAEQLDPTSVALHMEAGRVLAMLGRDADARQEFQQCEQLAGTDSVVASRAQHFAKNPSLGKQEVAPSFRLTASDGSALTLNDLSGKVVLLDFWATWCVVCRSDASYVRSVRYEFADEPFVLISISVDDSAVRWLQYIKDERMNWKQYRDEDRQLSHLFNVGAIPTYVVLDGDGVVRLHSIGTDADIKGKIRSLLDESRHGAGAEKAEAGAVPPLANRPDSK